MTPGAVAAILYARCRLADPSFELESEPAPADPSCYVLTASWRCALAGSARTYSSVLSLGHVQDLATFLDSCARALDRRADRA